jgi:2-polyprenyl-6-methoxyphenol hydroxylase-like FAD-dependent oxidoreductase
VSWPISLITILDRDVFPVRPDHRKGVPQSYHAHALLPTAFPILEQLFPGIMNDLCKDGAATASNIVPLAIVSPKGLLPLPKWPEIIAFSRYLLEWHVRYRVSRLPEVEIITEVEVAGLLATQDRTRVTGIRIRERGKVGHTNTRSLFGDLVVDASGRHSQAPQWLVELGYEAPSVETINSNLRYASRFYAKPDQFAAEWHSLAVNEGPPHGAGFILAVDNERWHVTLGGMAGIVPPLDEEGFLKWAQDLHDPSIYEALRIAQPLTPIRGSGTPENHWRHFERMHGWPMGFIVTGDAVCAFNPIYGQGMTVSAMDAMTIQQCLQEQQRSPREDFEHHLQRQIAKITASVWLIATNEDLRWPTVKLRGARPNPGLRFLRNYLDLVLFSAIVDPEVAQAYFNILILATPPNSMVRPRMMTRILVAATKRAVKRLLRRKETPGFALSSDVLSSLRNRPATSMPVSFIEKTI